MKQAATYTVTKVDEYGARTAHAQMGDRLTEDELELVLKKHELGLLVKQGVGLDTYNEKSYGCINQHVYGLTNVDTAYQANKAIGCWFDREYQSHWLRGEFEFELRRRNFVEEAL